MAYWFKHGKDSNYWWSGGQNLREAVYRTGEANQTKLCAATGLRMYTSLFMFVK